MPAFLLEQRHSRRGSIDVKIAGTERSPGESGRWPPASESTRTPGVIARHRDDGRRDVRYVLGDALAWLKNESFDGRTLIYCNPPYLGEARSEPTRRFYQHEMLERGRHAELLRILTPLPAMVMISGYENAIYSQVLGAA